MLGILQGKATAAIIREQMHRDLPPEDLRMLLHVVRTKPLKLSTRALAILAHLRNIPVRVSGQFLMITEHTVRAYISEFEAGGVTRLLDLRRKEVKKCEDARYKEALLAVLHAPPSDYDINRTSWRMDDLHSVMTAKGMKLNKGAIRAILRDGGYHFRKARRVLTSNDPEYREKVDHIKSILANLKPTESFFSVDEFGPLPPEIRHAHRGTGTPPEHSFSMSLSRSSVAWPGPLSTTATTRA